MIYVHYPEQGDQLNSVKHKEGRPSIVLSTGNKKVIRVVPASDLDGYQGRIDYSLKVPAGQLGLGSKESVIACGEVQVADIGRINVAKGIWGAVSPLLMERCDEKLKEALGIAI